MTLLRRLLIQLPRVNRLGSKDMVSFRRRRRPCLLQRFTTVLQVDRGFQRCSHRLQSGCHRGRSHEVIVVAKVLVGFDVAVGFGVKQQRRVEQVRFVICEVL